MDRVDEILPLKGLGNELIGAELVGFLGFYDLREPRDEDHRDIATRSNPPGELKTIHLGHANVRDHQVIRALTEELHALLAMDRSRDLVTQSLKSLLKRRAKGFIVVDQ